jgi:short-subunit dehydrogenase involved in D-alanine esterification of teichoic acids
MCFDIMRDTCHRPCNVPFHGMQTADKCKADGARNVETHAADLISVQARDNLISGLLAEHSSIDILVNAAGMLANEAMLQASSSRC